MSQPTVALVVANHDGAHHLPMLLDSVAALDYGADQLEVIVVDNASSDGSRELLADRYPWVRVLPQQENLGFAEAVNVGARAASSDCLAFANNDMRLAPDWLSELVRSYAPDQGYPCVAGVILDWEGERIDFVDGFVNFHGSAGQEHFGKPASEVPVEDGRELPFACGGSMLVNRALFVEVGGFDPSFFAFLEDVDLGWRLRLAGHKVRLAARARCFHRHHGTTSSLAPEQRLFLYERNALRMLLKNLDEPNLGRVLAPALLLLVERSLLDSGFERASFETGASGDATEKAMSPLGLASLNAVRDVLADLDGLLADRERVQTLRRRSDADVFATFRRPFFAVHSDSEYLEAEARLTRLFGLDELFPERRAARLLVVGRSPRTLELARAAARFVPVVLATPHRASPAVGVEVVRLHDAAQLEGLAAEADAVLVEAGAPIPVGVGGRLILDLAGANGAEFPLDRADLLLCASEGERERLSAAVDGEPPVAVVPTGDADDPVRPLRQLLERPRTTRATTEEVQRLLSYWRTEYGVGRPLHWHLARALRRSLPEPIRRRLRRVRGSG